MASLFGISLCAMCLHIQYYKKILHINIYIYKCTFFGLNHSFFVHSLCKFMIQFQCCFVPEVFVQKLFDLNEWFVN